MKGSVNKKPFLVFNILVTYVLVQLVWWGYLIIALMHTVYGESDTFSSKLRMIIGEGIVFLVLLGIGIVITRKTFRKELWMNQQQRNFLLSITHELKTPLASTRLVLETLEQRELPVEKRKELLRQAMQENQRLTDLIENILLSARLDQPTFHVHAERKNLSELVEDLVHRIGSSVGQYHDVQHDIEGGLYVNMDATLISSVLANLIENAIKYSDKGKSIRVRLHATGQRALLEVSDEGKGIPDAEKAKIFDKFYRGGNEEVRTVKGTGLGLYLSKEICERHGFTLAVKDHAPQGSVFEVSMPLAAS